MPSREASRPDDPRTIPGACLVLVTVIFLVYGQALWFDLLNYDDNDYVTANGPVLAGLTWESASWAFRETHSNNWHPLTWLSLMLDVSCFGPRPGGFHFTNVLLHAANTVLLLLLLARMTGARWRSILVAALFALHPLHVESVAWVSERKDVLSMFFGLLALLAYTQYVRRLDSTVPNPQPTDARPTPHASRLTPHAPRYYLLALLGFAFSLMSKPMFVTLPFLMLLLDRWPFQRWPGNEGRGKAGLLIAEKLPFLLLSAISCWITLAAQSGAIHPLHRLSLGIRSVNAVVAYGRYLGKTFWPVDLAVPYPHYGYGSFRLFCACAALLLAVTLFAILARRRLPFLVTGWFWYLGTLVPVIGLVQVGMQSMADRYTYLPLIGVFIIAAWGGNEILGRWKPPRAAVATVAVLLLAGLAVLSAAQLRFWRNSETLFLHAIAVTRGNDTAHYNLGEYYLQQGRLNEAIRHFKLAAEIRSSHDDALNNLGVALAMKGAPDQAEAPIREAIRLRPDRADAQYNLGNVLAMQHKLDEAAAAYTQALRLKPDYPEAHHNLANVLVLQGRREEAAQHYRETLRVNPNHAAARRQLQQLERPPATEAP